MTTCLAPVLLPLPSIGKPAPSRRPSELAHHDIGFRLENWARVYRPTRTIGVSPTGAFCDRLKHEAEGEPPSGERRKADEVDASAIEHAMRQLSRRDRLMLKYCYIDQAEPHVVCRKLSIAHRPPAVFIAKLGQAQTAVEQVLMQQEH